MLDDAWLSTRHVTHPAVSDLLRQADALLDAGKLEQAADKVERALRIDPDHAPSWSRMAKLALESGQPQRAVRMAQKSNSHAGTADRLRLQNWEYIRQARLALHDAAGVTEAEREISRLQGGG